MMMMHHDEKEDFELQPRRIAYILHSQSHVQKMNWQRVHCTKSLTLIL